MNYEKKIHSNIINFPGVKRPELDRAEKEVARLLHSAAYKMSKNDWEQHPITHKELSALSNYGEAIEHPPQVASRLISVLATSLIRNSLEDLIWAEKKEKVIFLMTRKLS